MVYCNVSLFSYGIIVSISEAIELLNALRKIHSSSIVDGSTSDRILPDELDIENWSYDCVEELSSLIKHQLAQVELIEGEEQPVFCIDNLGSDDEGSKGVVVIFEGIYEKHEDEETGKHSNGLRMELWGEYNGASRYLIITSLCALIVTAFPQRLRYSNAL